MTRPDRLAAALVTATVLLSIVPRSAHADEPQEAGEYRVFFDEGRQLVREGRYAEALESFRKSLASKEGAGTLLNIGDCQEKLGQYASAVASFERARAIASDKGQLERQKEAEGRLPRLRPLVSTLTVVSSLKDTNVEVDGALIELGKPMPINGGAHVVRVHVRCYLTKDLPVTVALKSDAVSVPIDASTLAPDPACGAPAGPSTSTSTSTNPGSTQRTIAVVVGAAGVVAAGLGVGFGLAASGKQSDLESACRSYPTGCAPERRASIDGLYDDAQSAATISTIAIVSAAVLLGGAAALYFTAPSGAPRTGRAFLGRWTF